MQIITVPDRINLKKEIEGGREETTSANTCWMHSCYTFFAHVTSHKPE